MRGSVQSFEEMKSILEGFLRKASPDELSTLLKLFSSEAASAEWRVAFATLIEEVQKQALVDKTRIRSPIFSDSG